MGTHEDFHQFTPDHDDMRGARRHHDEAGPRFGRGFGPGMGRGRGQGFGPGMGAGFGQGFGAGFPFGPGGPGRGGRGRARKGDVRLAILSLLANAPANGYGLMKSIAERTDGAWKPSPGSVYPTLSQLVDEELIAESGEGRQSTFQLTEAGRGYVADHTDEIEKAWGEATADLTGQDDDFFGSVMKLAGVVKQFHFAATPEQRKVATAKVDELRRALYTILAD